MTISFECVINDIIDRQCHAELPAYNQHTTFSLDSVIAKSTYKNKFSKSSDDYIQGTGTPEFLIKSDISILTFPVPKICVNNLNILRLHK